MWCSPPFKSAAPLSAMQKRWCVCVRAFMCMCVVSESVCECVCQPYPSWPLSSSWSDGPPLRHPPPASSGTGEEAPCVPHPRSDIWARGPRSSRPARTWIRIIPLIYRCSKCSACGSRARYRPYSTSQVRSHEEKDLVIRVHVCQPAARTRLSPHRPVYCTGRRTSSCAHPIWTRSHFTSHCILCAYTLN